MRPSDDDLTLSRFAQLLEIHGGDLRRWPPGPQQAGRALVVRDPSAARQLAEAAALDRLLDLAPPAATASPGLFDRVAVAARTAAPAPGRERAGDWAADNVITLPRPPRPRHQVAAVAPAGWRPANRQLAAGGGMMAASLLIGVWLGATGLTPPVGPVGPVGIAQQTTRPNAAEFSTVGELVQAVLPIELLEDDEDHL